jgi:hypothetical protein
MEAVNKDTHCPAASQVLQPHNRTSPDLRVLVLSTINQQPCCPMVSDASQFRYCPHPLFCIPFSQYFFDEATGPVRFLKATEPFIGHPDGIHSHNSPEMTRTEYQDFFARSILPCRCLFLRKGIIKTVAGKSNFETNFKTYTGSLFIVSEASIRVSGRYWISELVKTPRTLFLDLRVFVKIVRTMRNLATLPKKKTSEKRILMHNNLKFFNSNKNLNFFVMINFIYF